MKVFLVLIVAVLIIVAGIFAFSHFRPTSGSLSPSPNIEVSLTGILNPVTPTSEYSFLLSTGSQSIGINSMKIDLATYSGKKVSIMGQYSGDVLYADSVQLIP